MECPPTVPGMEEWTVWFDELEQIAHTGPENFRKVRAAFWRCAWLDEADRLRELLQTTQNYSAIRNDMEDAQAFAWQWANWSQQ